MLDTELNKGKKNEIFPSTPLEVDKFFKLDIVPPIEAPVYAEPLIVEGNSNKELLFVYTDFHIVKEGGSWIHFKYSSDSGRTWDKEWVAADMNGKEVGGCHNSLVRLKSGRLGLVYSIFDKEYGHSGRESGMLIFYRTSDDGGHTWSNPIRLDTNHACCTTGHAMVLSSGRVLVPAFKWISSLPGNEAEGWITNEDEPAPTLSYSFAYYSDDEGKTWKKSLSELFLSINRAAYDLEEPTVVELKDGKLLMHMRSEVGRMYRSFSADGGVSWSVPEALQIAAAYTPQYLKRIPSTGDLIMVWNQSSRQEIVTGLHRHRLSCAISKDEGQTWENFKNLESLDDVTVITPPPSRETYAISPYESYGYYQPQPGMKRYHRAPGILRICYPTVAFTDNEVAIAYDIGQGSLGDKGGLRLRIIPVDWFLS